MNDDDFKDACAMLAMNGLIHHFDFDRFAQDPARVAEWSYLVANAMVEKRKKQGEENEEVDNGIAAVAPKRTRKR